MQCVVTGAAGFVGSSIVDRLLSDGHTVTGIDCFVDYYPKAIKVKNLEAAFKNKRFTLVEENILRCDLPKILQNTDWIFHQAAQAGVRASWGQYFETYCDNNILATQHLLEAAQKNGQIKKIVYASSSSVYGNAESYPTSEAMVPQPVSPYGVTKLAAEHLMSLYASEYGLPTVSLRYFTVYGPRQRPEMAFHRFIRAGLEGEDLTLFGDGEQSRDFTFISDIVEANLLAASQGQPGSVFNIGGGTQATINEVLTIISAYVGTLKVQRMDRQLGDARHTSADTTQAQTQLGYRPAVDLKEGIRRQVEWLRQVLAYEA